MSLGSVVKMSLSFMIAAFGAGDKPLLLFNTQPITPATINQPSRHFRVGEPVHYALINPKGFKSDYIRVQVIKKEEKTAHWGYSIYWAKDYKIDSTKDNYVNYVVINRPGYYFMQIYGFNDFDRVIARNDFWVVDQ